MPLVKVVDWSRWQGRVGRERISRMAADGVRGVVIGSWHGLSNNPHAEADLRDARELGLVTSTYIVVNNRPGALSVREGRAACGSEWEHLSSVWIDVEVAGVTEAILQDALDEAARLHRPSRVGVYTGKWFWDFWGVSLDRPVTRFAFYPLWTALYNGRFDLSFTPYGGWAECKMKQYRGSTPAYGTTVDFNAADRDWFFNVPPGPEPPPEQEDDIMGKIADRFAQLGREVEAEIAAAKKLPTPIPGPAGPRGPAGPPGAAPSGAVYDELRASDGHATGFAQRHGLTLQHLMDLNPAGPPSGNWNLVHAGERYRVG